MGLAAYANHYIQVSGLAPASPLGHEVRNLFNAVRHFVEYDHLDPANSAGLELLCRRILQIQIAVCRSAKHPDFSNLDAIPAAGPQSTVDANALQRVGCRVATAP